MIIVVIIVSLLLSAFFSGMEIAFVSSNKLLLEIDKKQNRVYNHIASLFLRRPAQYITTILVGNNIALVFYSLFMSYLIYPDGGGNYLVETAISTLVIIFTAEFLPKAVVRTAPNLYLRLFAIPLYVFYLLFYPIAIAATWLSRLLLRIFGINVSSSTISSGFSKVDLQSLVTQEIETETPTDNEIKIFQNALDFSDLKVRDCMVPRVEITAIEDSDSISDLREMFIRTKFSRIPVYRGTIDNIVGYVSSRQLFENPSSISSMLRAPIYTPESASVQRLLSDFIHSHRSLAIIIDEFGSTAGMITTEDILEEIFGEIDDEHDERYLVEKDLGNGEFLFSARCEIEQLNAQYDLKIPERDDYETLAGYILHHCQDIPAASDQFTLDGLTIRIVRSSKKRISLVKIQKESEK